ncbi:hypothetical protein ACFOLF_26070 [Paenibacillus sepulcri]|uniref:ABC transporter permease n=1 Tax=Paenibacillus sepulcri TaxID=359917 RepID=A0ABS7C1H7_9BACL|nr:hypothetical protein [Paenibacillus sepulcri]
MELVNRYIFAVTQKLPEKQRTDIEKELQGLIEDMLEERVQGREATRTDVEEVLLELGNPSELSERYRGDKRYLISPAIFSTYLSVLKMVIISIAVAMAVVFTIETFMTPSQVLHHLVSNLVSFLIVGCVQGFAWVTIMFVIIEVVNAKKRKLGIKGAHDWKLSELPALPDRRIRIKRAEPIASIIITVLFFVLFTFSIDLLGVWRFEDGGYSTVVSFFDEEVFRGFLPMIWILLALSILKDILMMISRKWTVRLVGFEILLNMLYFVLAVFMFSDMAIWNSDFMQQLAQSGITPVRSEAFERVSEIWARINEGLIYLIGLVIAVHVIFMAVKAFRIKQIS